MRGCGNAGANSLYIVTHLNAGGDLCRCYAIRSTASDMQFKIHTHSHTHKYIHNKTQQGRAYVYTDLTQPERWEHDLNSKIGHSSRFFGRRQFAASPENVPCTATFRKSRIFGNRIFEGGEAFRRKLGLKRLYER